MRGWAETNGLPLRTDGERVAAFIGWRREQAISLTGRLRIRTETGAVHGDVAVGTGRSVPPATGGPDATTTKAPPPDVGSGTTTKPMPPGEPAVDAGDSASAPKASKAAAGAPKPEEGGGAGKPPPSGPVVRRGRRRPGRRRRSLAGPADPAGPKLPTPYKQAKGEATTEISATSSGALRMA